MQKRLKVAVLSGLLLCGMAMTAAADVIVYAGYLNNNSPFDPADAPTPFDPSATTTLVSTGDSTTSHDTAIIRFQNVGSANVTIGSGLKVSVPGSAFVFQLWDGSLPFLLNPGANLVLAETSASPENFDMSENATTLGGAAAIVEGIVNGAAFTFTDTGRILYGNEDAGGGAETTPYGVLGRITIGNGGPTPTPEPGTLMLLTAALFGLRYLGRPS